MDELRDAPLSPRQLGALLWASGVSPMIRRAPGAVGPAGRAAWVSALLCLPAAWLLGLLLGRITADRRPGEGAGELLCRGMGALPGRVGCGLCGGWFVFYAGYVLRAGADRFVAAVYPESGEWVFMLVMGALALMAGAGAVKTLGRFAQLAGPCLGGVFVFVFLFCLPNVDPLNLLPLPAGFGRAAGRGMLPLAEALAVGAFPAFLAGRTEKGSLTWAFTGPLLALAVLGAALCVTIPGTYGPELAEKMNHPFFVMIRSVKIFDLLERVEALVAAQWVAADFVLLGLLLHLAAGSLTTALRGPGAAPGRGIAALCFGGMMLCAAGCASTAFRLRDLGEQVIGPGCALLSFGLRPGGWVLGKLRRKI